MVGLGLEHGVGFRAVGARDYQSGGCVGSVYPGVVEDRFAVRREPLLGLVAGVATSLPGVDLPRATV